MEAISHEVEHILKRCDHVLRGRIGNNRSPIRTDDVGFDAFVSNTVRIA